jgi:hypothetical protein
MGSRLRSEIAAPENTGPRVHGSTGPRVHSPSTGRVELFRGRGLVRGVPRLDPCDPNHEGGEEKTHPDLPARWSAGNFGVACEHFGIGGICAPVHLRRRHSRRLAVRCLTTWYARLLDAVFEMLGGNMTSEETWVFYVPTESTSHCRETCDKAWPRTRAKTDSSIPRYSSVYMIGPDRPRTKSFRGNQALWLGTDASVA